MHTVLFILYIHLTSVKTINYYAYINSPGGDGRKGGGGNSKCKECQKGRPDVSKKGLKGPKHFRS